MTALSHVGLVREQNEDSLVVGPWTLCATVTQNPQTLVFPLGRPLVVAVADGLGGQPGGEVASALVARRISTLGAALDSGEALGEALQACNRELYEAAGDRPGLATMGSTVAGLLVLEDSLLTFNIGDSKVYEVAPDGLHQLSVDDSPLPEPGRRTTSAVTQTLGGTRGFSPVVPHVSSREVSVGERYLVCSDGLTDPVTDEAIDRLLAVYDDGRAAFELWKAAIECGGPDNITLALVRIGA